MENNNQLKLPETFINYLENLPEQGMGYQIADIELFDGSVLVDRIIFNSTYLRLEKEDKITTDKIKEIRIKLK